MRLTLRNLLAYLHGIMSPADRAAFDPLVAGAPRMGTLVERCRKLPGNPKLSAPALDQASALHAAETVAMYLDFALPDEHLAPFEKAALASDEQLAEIVDCHRVLADVVAQRANVDLPAWRARIIEVGQAANTRTPQAAPTPAAAPQQNVTLVNTALINQESMHDSGDLSGYLADTDDEEELSLDVVAQRAREVEKRSNEAAASAYAATSAGSATATEPAPKARTTNYGTRDPFKKQASAVPVALTDAPERSPLPLLLGALGGGVLVIGLVVWLGASMFSGGGGQVRKPQGPPVYGVDAGGQTCEFKGKITYQPEGSPPSPDVGAVILLWPVKSSESVIRLTSQAVFENLAANKLQSDYNKELIAAKTDDDGKFHLRAQEHPEYYVMILSQRSQTTRPKTYGEAMDALKSQLEDPPEIVGQRNYHFDKISTPENKLGTLEHTFKE